MSTIQTNGILEDQITSSLESLYQTTAHYTSSWDSSDFIYPVRYEGESVFFRRELMKEDLPYPFIFQGKKAFVIRKGDELNFFEC